MDVHEARCHRQSVGVDRSRRLIGHPADRDDAALGDTHISGEARLSPYRRRTVAPLIRRSSIAFPPAHPGHIADRIEYPPVIGRWVGSRQTNPKRQPRRWGREALTSRNSPATVEIDERVRRYAVRSRMGGRICARGSFPKCASLNSTANRKVTQPPRGRFTRHDYFKTSRH